ncbi:hypothetical protein GOQ29_03980 [Clostridium sp. D2Q-14]|uniref:DUF6933 domain-containing protein n=1 Tax=Anaeromonas gelatinilytica TaxID=2683194 RepID=UPI00193C4F52|nr:hypothetical protein [Anaeromonas gelatinilytica]MBS4534771.1 hypothetical protein [Anaeromonas gelatinilytica]
MLAIQCSKKLRKQLKIDIPKKIPSSLDSFYSWHSHLFILNRKKCTIVMNNLTRYNFILVGLKKEDFKVYDQMVVDAIRDNLLAEGATKKEVDKYIKNCGSPIYLQASDRSIISQMNEMIRVIGYWNSIDKQDGVETDLKEINRRLNSFMMLKLPKSYSGETMLDELKILV